MRECDILSRLQTTIEARKSAEPETSYVAHLLQGGTPLMARKLSEEAIETTIAALSGSQADLLEEAADLVFHLMVLLIGKGADLNAVCDILAEREGMSGIEEKASREVK